MSIPIENRACPNPSYSGDVEDETHFLLSCKIYNGVRKNLIDFVFEKYPNVKLLDKGDLLNWLMSYEDKEVLRELGKFAEACFKIRSKLIGMYEHMV